MKTYTDLDTLNQAFTFLQNNQLEFIFGDVEALARFEEQGIQPVLDQLLRHGGLVEFCQIITRSQEQFNDPEVHSFEFIANEVIVPFFASLAGTVRGALATINSGGSLTKKKA